MDVRTNFAQEEPHGLQCLTMTSAVCVVEDLSIYMDTLSLEFWNFGADTASAACPAQSGSLATPSTTYAAVIWDADEPCSVKTA